MSNIKPWGNFVAVVDPPMECNDGTHNGVIIPKGFGLDVLDKGVVVGVGPCVEDGEHTPEGFGVGAVVWFEHGKVVEVGDLKFIPAHYLIAWEPTPATADLS